MKSHSILQPVENSNDGKDIPSTTATSSDLPQSVSAGDSTVPEGNVSSEKDTTLKTSEQADEATQAKPAECPVAPAKTEANPTETVPAVSKPAETIPAVASPAEKPPAVSLSAETKPVVKSPAENAPAVTETDATSKNTDNAAITTVAIPQSKEVAIPQPKQEVTQQPTKPQEEAAKTTCL